MTAEPWTWRHGGGPIVATAIHAGHELRPEVAAATALSDEARLREEDPHTDTWTSVVDSAVVFNRSRWEVDVNRDRERSVYLEPEDCWGLRPWRFPPPADVIEQSHRLYDDFYRQLYAVCDDKRRAFERFVVLDLHSYNHRRLGPAGPEADPDDNPEVNVGTASMDRARWGPLVDQFLTDLRNCGLDARENVRFRGAALARWTHENFPEAGCCLAVDVKKVFMDEHTGEVRHDDLRRIGDALAAAVPNLVRRLTG